MVERVLIIRLGALGDLTLCAPAFQAIREAHPHARIALLTQPAWKPYAQSMPWFNEVITDARAPLSDLRVWHNLILTLNTFAPTHVYDLQGKLRQSLIFWFMGGVFRRFLWSGAARGCSHPRVWPPQQGWHFVDFIKAQLAKAQVQWPQQEDWSWLDASIDAFNLPEKYVLFIPSCFAAAPTKTLAAQCYAHLAQMLHDEGLPVVVLGAKSDADAINEIQALAPFIVNICGQTNLKQIGGVARKAHCVIGNDTGPLHMAAAVGAPVLALFNNTGNPVWSAPRGARVSVLHQPLQELKAEAVLAELTI